MGSGTRCHTIYWAFTKHYPLPLLKLCLYDWTNNMVGIPIWSVIKIRGGKGTKNKKKGNIGLLVNIFQVFKCSFYITMLQLYKIWYK